MIGQSSIRDIFIDMANNDVFPRFTLLIGPKGSGKTTLAKEIGALVTESKENVLELPDVKIDSIREMIKNAYVFTNPTVYIISDADEMSMAAKNSLLKICEEPPASTYIIMTLTSKNNTLETITSRAQTFIMQPYTKNELEEYMCSLTDSCNGDLILELSETPGDVRYLLSVGVDDFYEYTEKVVDNIAEVSGANAFKIAEKISLKTDADGYNLEMFFRIFQHICLQRMHDTDEKDRYLNGITITNHNLLNLNVKGVNRQFVIDSWILEIRRAWM